MSLRFVDMFAGLGGFHLALASLGHRCVFACESDPTLRGLYLKNFGFLPEEDIRSIHARDVPDHDVFCAGFPCQPFSKAGEQKGLGCKRNGDLFGDHVIRIIKAKKPNFLLLENVANLVKHNGGATFRRIEDSLCRLGYEIDHHQYSPHEFGIPQVRERVFIVGRKRSLGAFEWPVPVDAGLSLEEDIIEEMPDDALPISEEKYECLEVWQEFLNRSRPCGELPSFPIWTMEFGATYPFEEATPYAVGERRLLKYRGAFGESLRQYGNGERLSALPSHAQTEELVFPRWKQTFIRQNREFYKANRSWIRPWLSQIRQFPPSLQKLEWNCKGERRNIWDNIIQFRASGVRVKRPITAPSLIAMTTTQVPIVAWEGRYMTPRECSKLQSMDQLRYLPDIRGRAYRALGNAVNVEIVKAVGAELFGKSRRRRRQGVGLKHAGYTGRLAS